MVRRNGFTPLAKQTSDLKTFPMPATTDCRSNASPTSISGLARRFVELRREHIGPQVLHAAIPGENLTSLAVQAGFCYD
jgi:hypothetical protein